VISCKKPIKKFGTLILKVSQMFLPDRVEWACRVSISTRWSYLSGVARPRCASLCVDRDVNFEVWRSVASTTTTLSRRTFAELSICCQRNYFFFHFCFWLGSSHYD